MSSFEEYRNKNGYSAKSIRVQNSHVNRLKSWCINQNINLERINYNQALQFIDSERERGILNQSIIRGINSIRIYFDYLLEIGTVKQNIIKRIRIRQNGKKVIPETLTPQQLETIYHDFMNIPEWEHKTQTAKELHKRNVVLLGLLVYQGLTSGETAKLETNHINLAEGKIYIPSTRKSNARTLKLQANQILPIKTYIEEFKPNPYLFPSKKQSDMICKIVEQAKKDHPEIIDSRQIRTSVIMNWLKTNNIRQVQYMAGHKSIRSTEQYRSHDLSDLTKQLELFHPLR
ncbi:MAG: tyrosine-type recombinase/integrase [Caldisericales bacterium]|nr:tyrosine-type recombinase/integrase [Caldisericales bacterium]